MNKQTEYDTREHLLATGEHLCMQRGFTGMGLSALLGGVGIGIIQAVMPSVIKRRFQHRTPLVMGLWSAALMGGGGLGAAITPWLVQHSETWYQTLAWWALPAVVALFAW